MDYSEDQIKALAKKVGVEWDKVDYDLECFGEGFEEERDEHKDFSDVQCAQIAKDHFDEHGGKYYECLEAMTERLDKIEEGEIDVLISQY